MCTVVTRNTNKTIYSKLNIKKKKNWGLTFFYTQIQGRSAEGKDGVNAKNIFNNLKFLKKSQYIKISFFVDLFPW